MLNNRKYENIYIMNTKLFIGILVVSLNCQLVKAQMVNEVIVGTIENGNAFISKEASFVKYFNQSLNYDGTLGPLNSVVHPDGIHIYIGCQISGNKMNKTSIGIITLIHANKIYILNERSSIIQMMGMGTGVSAKITCTGDPCNACWIQSLAAPPYFQCICNQSPPCAECKCNMTITAEVEIGLF